MMSTMLFDEFKSLGNNSDKGNIVGIQPHLTQESYLSQATFQKNLDSYLEYLQASGYINDKTLVIFPEHIGSWLVCADENVDFKSKKTIGELIQSMYATYTDKFQKYIANSDKELKEFAAAFHIKASKIAAYYQETFSYLAKKYQVTIVGGSVVLENPDVINGKIVCNSGPLYNGSAVFYPDGTISPNLIKKIHLVPTELGFLSGGSINEQHIYELPLGKLCVLICADSWYSECYKLAINNTADIIAVPSYQDELDLWDKKWRGYTVDSPEDAYDTKDIGTITEGEAWKKYALAQKIKKTKAAVGINVFLKGELWEMGANSGHSLVIKDNTQAEISTDKAGFVNVWL